MSQGFGFDVAGVSALGSHQAAGKVLTGAELSSEYSMGEQSTSKFVQIAGRTHFS